MKKKDFKHCYMCGKPASSREHVPPACLFPEEKDIKTSIFRNNLITVPSCDLHNSRKSKDDEFLMGCLAGIVGNNVIGFFHAHTKVRRALERKGKDAIHELMQTPRELNLKSAKGYDFPVLVGRPDLERLTSCFRHIACGLYYHQFGKIFEGEVNVIIDFITFENENSEKLRQLVKKRMEFEPLGKTAGANPEIFKFRFFPPDEFGLIALHLTFYEGAHVFIAFKGKESKEPQNLAMEFINNGIKTIVGFPDGSAIEFN